MKQIDFGVLVVAFVAASFLWTYFKIIRVKMLGVEANAVVTRLEEHETTDADGIPSTFYEAYVRYQAQDGRLVNASLRNPGQNQIYPGPGRRSRAGMKDGSWHRIRASGSVPGARFHMDGDRSLWYDKYN